MKLGDMIVTSNSDHKTCKQFDKQCSSCNNKQPQAIHYDRDIYGHVTHSHKNQSRRKLGIHIPFSEHTTIITVNIVVNNVVLNKQPQAMHLAISETRRYRLGDVIATSNSDHTSM